MTPELNIVEIEKFIGQLKIRTTSFQLPIKTDSRELLASNALCLLCKVLNYSINLNSGILELYKVNNIFPTIMLIRTNYEAAGVLGNLHEKMSKYYNEHLSLEDYNALLRRYLLGSKTLNIPECEVPTPINVLNGIDSIDKWMSQNENSTEDIIRDCYNYLSEFCHPNFHGLSIGTAFNEGFIQPKSYEEISILHSNDFFKYLQISNIIMLDFSDKILKILNANEDLSFTTQA